MRAAPAFQAPFLLISVSSVLASGCLLDASAYGDASGTTTTTTTSTGGSGGQTTTTTPSMTGGGGAGGVTTTSSMGGTGGVGGSTGGTGGTGGTPVFQSCKKALDAGFDASGIFKIDPDTPAQPEPEMDVYCDQEHMGGGWALLYTSYGKADGTTTDFWNIFYEERLTVVGVEGPTLTGNYYAGNLYKFGTEYRDDLEDGDGHVAYGVIHAKATSIDQTTMHFNGALKLADNLSADLFNSQFASGWGAPGHDYDGEEFVDCSATWANVTQHYGGCWYYSLGADLAKTGPQMDHRDSGWGPHISNKTLTDINTELTAQSKQNLHFVGDPNPALSTRLQRISRFAKW